MPRILRTALLMMLYSQSALLADDNQYNTQVCAACHGANGLSTDPTIPHLAGQKATYMELELKAFRDGIRKNMQMEAVVKNITDQEINQIALYYSQLPAVNKKVTKVNQLGLNTRAFCVSCHGMTGKTVNEQWPNLAGQQMDYLKNQLQAFRSGTRPGFYMSVIANELNDEQIEAVAEYYSQISGDSDE